MRKSFTVGGRSSPWARIALPNDSARLGMYRPSQWCPMPLLRINAVAPSRIRLWTMAGASRWTGTDTSPTFAPNSLRMPTAFLTDSSTSGSDRGVPKPSVNTPIRRPAIPRPNSSVYGSTGTSPACRGSIVSLPAMASMARATSATVRAIGPVWSQVLSIPTIPV